MLMEDAETRKLGVLREKLERRESKREEVDRKGAAMATEKRRVWGGREREMAAAKAMGLLAYFLTL